MAILKDISSLRGKILSGGIYHTNIFYQLNLN
jgi:hypothetical protein